MVAQTPSAVCTDVAKGVGKDAAALGPPVEALLLEQPPRLIAKRPTMATAARLTRLPSRFCHHAFAITLLMVPANISEKEDSVAPEAGPGSVSRRSRVRPSGSMTYAYSLCPIIAPPGK